MEKGINFKLGNNIIPYQFSLQGFWNKYVAQNPGKSPENLIEDFVYGESNKYAYSHEMTSPINKPFFQNGQPITKTKKGLFGKKQVAEPARNFLLFEDEYLQELNPAADLPLSIDQVSNKLSAGKIYSTGKRIILDSRYTEDSHFKSNQFWGKVDLRNIASAFGRQDGFTIPLPLELHGNARTMQNVIEAKIEYREQTMPVIVNIEWDLEEKFVLYVHYMFRNTNGWTEKGPGQFFLKKTEIFKPELEKLQPVNLEDLLAMWDCAAAYGLLQSTFKMGPVRLSPG